MSRNLRKLGKNKISKVIAILLTIYCINRNFYSVKNQVFSDPTMLAGRSTQIFDIRQKFGASSIEIEGGKLVTFYPQLLPV